MSVTPRTWGTSSAPRQQRPSPLADFATLDRPSSAKIDQPSPAAAAAAKGVYENNYVFGQIFSHMEVSELANVSTVNQRFLSQAMDEVGQRVTVPLKVIKTAKCKPYKEALSGGVRRIEVDKALCLAPDYYSDCQDFGYPQLQSFIERCPLLREVICPDRLALPTEDSMYKPTTGRSFWRWKLGIARSYDEAGEQSYTVELDILESIDVAEALAEAEASNQPFFPPQSTPMGPQWQPIKLHNCWTDPQVRILRRTHFSVELGQSTSDNDRLMHFVLGGDADDRDVVLSTKHVGWITAVNWCARLLKSLKDSSKSLSRLTIVGKFPTRSQRSPQHNLSPIMRYESVTWKRLCLRDTQSNSHDLSDILAWVMPPPGVHVIIGADGFDAHHDQSADTTAVLELQMRNVKYTPLISCPTLASHLGTDLQVLDIAQMYSDQASINSGYALPLKQLPEFVDLLKQQLPLLRLLSFAVAISVPQTGLNDIDFPITDHAWAGSLDNCSIMIEKDGLHQRHPADVPYFAIAKNVAALCTRSAAVRQHEHVGDGDILQGSRTEGMSQVDFGDLVRWLLSLSPTRQAVIRSADFAKLGVYPIGRWPGMTWRDIAFEGDIPIPVHLKLCAAIAQGLREAADAGTKDISIQAYVKYLDRAHAEHGLRPAADR